MLNKQSGGVVYFVSVHSSRELQTFTEFVDTVRKAMEFVDIVPAERNAVIGKEGLPGVTFSFEINSPLELEEVLEVSGIFHTTLFEHEENFFEITLNIPTGIKGALEYTEIYNDLLESISFPQ